VLDTGAFDAGGKAAADFRRQLRRDLVAQESRYLLGLDREDRLPREFLVERLVDLSLRPLATGAPVAATKRLKPPAPSAL